MPIVFDDERPAKPTIAYDDEPAVPGPGLSDAAAADYLLGRIKLAESMPPAPTVQGMVEEMAAEQERRELAALPWTERRKRDLQRGVNLLQASVLSAADIASQLTPTFTKRLPGGQVEEVRPFGFSPEMEKAVRREVQREVRENERLKPAVGSLFEARSPWDYMELAQSRVLESAPMVLPSAAGGGVPAVAGRGLMAATTGAFLGNVAQEAGIVGTQQTMEGKNNAARALLAAIPAAAADTLTDRLALSGALRVGSRSLPGMAARGAVSEGLTEPVQGIIEDIGTSNEAARQRFSVEGARQLADEAFGGAVGGGVITAGTTALGRMLPERRVSLPPPVQRPAAAPQVAQAEMPFGQKTIRGNPDLGEFESAAEEMGVPVRFASPYEASLFSNEGFATINSAGEVIVHPERAAAYLSQFESEKDKKKFIRSILAHEWLHSAATPEDALAYRQNSTPLERALSDRVYLGPNLTPEDAGVNDVQLGYEQLRFAQSRLASMTPSEVVESKGMEWLTVQSALALLRIVEKARAVMGTKASQEQRAVVNRVMGNLEAFLESRGVDPNDVREEARQEADIYSSENAPFAITREGGDALRELSRIAGMSADEFRAQGRNVSTEKFRNLGAQIKTDEEFLELVRLRDKARESAEAAMRDYRDAAISAGSKEKFRALDKAISESTRAQFFNEALEVVTGVYDPVTGQKGDAAALEAAIRQRLEAVGVAGPQAIRRNRVPESQTELPLFAQPVSQPEARPVPRREALQPELPLDVPAPPATPVFSPPGPAMSPPRVAGVPQSTTALEQGVMDFGPASGSGVLGRKKTATPARKSWTQFWRELFSGDVSGYPRPWTLRSEKRGPRTVFYVVDANGGLVGDIPQRPGQSISQLQSEAEALVARGNSIPNEPAAPAPEAVPPPPPEPVASPEPAAQPKGRATAETIPGTRSVAIRIVNAEEKFIEFAMETAGLTRRQAIDAMQVMRDANALVIDPVVGQFRFTHGRFAEPDIIRRAVEMAEEERRQSQQAIRRRGGREPEGQLRLFLPPESSPEGRVTASEVIAQSIPPINPNAVTEAAFAELEKTRPSFSNFYEEMRQLYPELTRGQLRDTWIDAVWKKLLDASGDELRRLRTALNLRRILKRDDIDIGPVPDAPEGEAPLIETDEEANKAKTPEGARTEKERRETARRQFVWTGRRRALVQAEIGNKLISEAEEGRRAYNRREFSVEEIAFDKPNAWRSISPSEEKDAELLGRIITEGAAVDRTTRQRSVVGDKVVEVKSKALPPTVTRRLVAMHDRKTGRVEVVSTYRDTKVGAMVADPNLIALGKQRPNVRLAELLERTHEGRPRYRIFKTILLDEPVQNFHQRFESVDAFRDEIGYEAGERAQRLAELMAEQQAADVSESDEPERPALRTAGPLTDAEAGALLDTLYDEVNILESAEDMNSLVSGLADRASRRRLTGRDWATIVALEKAVTEVERNNPDWRGTDKAVTETLNQIYELAQQAQTRDEFVASALEQFASSQEAEGPFPVAAQTDAERRTTALVERAKLTGEIAGREAAKDAWLLQRRLLNDPARAAAGTPYTPTLRAERSLAARPRRIESPPPTPEQVRETGRRNLQQLEQAEEQRLAAERLRDTPRLQQWLRERDPLNYPARVPRGTTATESAAGPQAVARGISRRKEMVRDAIANPLKWYSEWLPDRLESASDGALANVARIARSIVDREKQLYGEISDVIDAARTEAGKAGRATTWANGLSRVTSRTAVRNVVGAIEGSTSVPPYAQKLIESARSANLLIGRLYESVAAGEQGDGFTASGMFQRNLTGFGYDVIRRGKGRVWNDWTEGLAAANGIPVAAVRRFFRRWKRILDDPDSGTVNIEAVNQDFKRRFPKVVTDVKVDGVLGSSWEPVVHADLFNYLEHSARKATHIRAFREVFPASNEGRRRLLAVIRSARSNLEPQYHSDVDALFRALQGNPTDTYSGFSFLSPDRPIGASFRFINNTLGNLMARMVLTGQMFVQPGETLFGSAPVFMGAKRYLRAMASLKQLYPELERAGARNAVVYDWSFDRASPVRSAFRIAGNAISKGFAEQLLNEIQEGLAAATASIVAEDIRSGNLSEWDRKMLPKTFQAMGFSREESRQMIEGRRPELLEQFQRKAAAFLTAGNRAMAEGSALASSRLFNSIFRFQSYPMAKTNQLVRLFSRFADDWSKGSAAERNASARMLGRFLFGNMLQGAATVAITSLFYGGLKGEDLRIRAKEAVDSPLRFIVESMLASISGPLYLVMRGITDSGVRGIGKEALRLVFPYTMVSDLSDLFSARGNYKDLPLPERIGKYVNQKMPGTRAISSGLALFGLSQSDKELDAAVKAFYRWRRQALGYRETETFFRDDERKAFRVNMKKAVTHLGRGELDEAMTAIGEAVQVSELNDFRQISSSLRGRQLLRDLNGAKLDEEAMESLRQRIGDRAVDRLIAHDQMIEALADIISPARN